MGSRPIGLVAACGRSGALFCEGETYGFTLALPFPFQNCLLGGAWRPMRRLCYHGVPWLVVPRKSMHVLKAQLAITGATFSWSHQRRRTVVAGAYLRHLREPKTRCPCSHSFLTIQRERRAREENRRFSSCISTPRRGRTPQKTDIVVKFKAWLQPALTLLHYLCPKRDHSHWQHHNRRHLGPAP